MFFIFGFGNRKGGEQKLLDSFGRGYTIFYIANCFSLFFIPVIIFSKRFFIVANGYEKEITKEEYNEMKRSGRVLQRYESPAASGQNENDNNPQDENAKYAGGVCPVCKKELTEDFAFCPYCGQKRPRV